MDPREEAVEKIRENQEKAEALVSAVSGGSPIMRCIGFILLLPNILLHLKHIVVVPLQRLLRLPYPGVEPHKAVIQRGCSQMVRFGQRARV